MKQALTDGLWAHIGALIAVAIGFADVVHFHSLGVNADEFLIIGGLAALGVNIINQATAK